MQQDRGRHRSDIGIGSRARSRCAPHQV